MTWWGMLRGRAAAEGGGRMTRTAKRAELPSQLAALQAELDTTAPEAQGAAGAAHVADPADSEADSGG